MIIRKMTKDDAAGVAYVHVRTWQTAYREILPETFLAARSFDRSKANWLRNLDKAESTTYVAEDEDAGIVGFVSFGPNRDAADYPEYEAELYAIYILETHARKGTGSKLWRRALEDFKAKGYRSFLLWMLEGNSTAAFYEYHGGEIIGTKPVRIGESDYTTVGYGFRID